MLSTYRSIIKHISKAYAVYGGLEEIVRSPYLHVSIALGILSMAREGSAWPSHVISISPSLLGFTLAGYTVFVASVSGRLLNALVKAKARDGHSYFQKVNSAFFHFIFVQSVAILFALTFPVITSFSLPLSIKGFPYASELNQAGYELLSCAGWALLFYSVLLVVAVLIWVFRIISLNEQAVLRELSETPTDENSGHA